MWVQTVFSFLLVPLLIVLLIAYAKTKKLYRVMYILSVFSYGMAIMYPIDAYDLGRNWILALLAFSAGLMMFIGYQMHKETKHTARGRKR